MKSLEVEENKITNLYDLRDKIVSQTKKRRNKDDKICRSSRN